MEFGLLPGPLLGITPQMPWNKVSRVLKQLLVKWNLSVNRKEPYSGSRRMAHLKSVIGESLVKRWFTKVRPELRKTGKGW